MEFKLIVDRTKEEEIVATVHNPSALTQEIEALVRQYTGADRIPAYTQDDIRMLDFSQIACITVSEGKTYAIDIKKQQYRLKQRLYELEKVLPKYFIRINKSAIANEKQLERFAVTYSGAVDAVFKCGYREYVSRRCFAEIKRRYSIK